MLGQWKAGNAHACRTQPPHWEVAEPVVTTVQVAKPPPKDPDDAAEGGGGAVVIVVVVLVVLAVVGLVVWKFVRLPRPAGRAPGSLPRSDLCVSLCVEFLPSFGPSVTVS